MKFAFMRQLLGFTFFLFLSTNCWAQRVDTLPSKDIKIAIEKILLNTNHSIAISQLDSLLQQSEILKKFPLSKADILKAKGKQQQLEGALFEATESYSKSFKIYDSLRYNKGMVSSLIQLGVINIINQKPEISREYLNHALRISNNASNSTMATILINLGVTYDMQGNSSEAIKTYKLALNYAEKNNDKETIASLYHGIGIAYSMSGDFKNGEYYEKKALESLPSNKLKSQILGSLGSFYLEYGRSDKSEKCLTEAIAIAEKEKYWDILLTCYLNISDFYRSENRNGEAVLALEKYINLKDSIDRRNTNDKLEEQEIKFRFDLQKKALELSEIKAENQKKGFITLGFICILLIVISFVSYRNYRLKQKANKQLSVEKGLIELERRHLEEENTILQKENIIAKFETLKDQINPHFLFNALNSLYALVDSDPKKSKEFIKQFSLLYRNVLEFNDHTVINLKKELEFVNRYLYLQQIRFGSNLIVNVNIDSNFNNYFLPPFSLQMLIENAVKHNEVSSDNPLKIEISTDTNNKTIRIVNSLHHRKESEVLSTGTGLKNIIKRYAILSDLSPEFIIKQDLYIATLPLLEEEL